MPPRRLSFAMLALLLSAGPTAAADSQHHQLNGHRFTLPAGFEISVAAAPPLVERPICCDFDEQGRLYVAESSGSNDNVQTQLQERPHRILRLEDRDGDGVFDHRSVFADRMMFPEGAMWLDGSLYVAAPPVIWKLTDTDGDGAADERREWFDGKTLTGCANDLHGPYYGPDGWIYWCKGAFAEQTYERPGGPPLVTRAAHIFRRRPAGGAIEAVMTGGMDNPVEVVFTPGGERIFTTTFLQRPGGGRRDGLIHAIYGGVYGKRHGVLEGHPRTGELMPVLTHQGAAAPCGLTLLESNELGDEFRGNVLACLFNMHKVTRHVLVPQGATFQTRDEDFLVSDQLDFHPTDVIEDADGSLLVIDTGGWYKLCCPTSQLHKPDVLGAIYRVRRGGGHAVADGGGRKLDFRDLGLDQLMARLADPRPYVRRRAGQLLSQQGAAAVDELSAVRESAAAAPVRLAAVWALTRIDHPSARRAVRRALADRDGEVRQAALHAVSVHRDRAALAPLIELLEGPSPANRRAAAEALGRLGDPAAVEALLSAAGRETDRALEHSLTFALIEIADPRATSAGLASDNPLTRRAALVALDQMQDGQLPAEPVVTALASAQPALREAAGWIVERHPEWAPQLLPYFQAQLADGDLADERRSELQRQLAALATQPVMVTMLAEALADARLGAAAKRTVLAAMAGSGAQQLPGAWQPPLAALLAGDDDDLVPAAVDTARACGDTKMFAASLTAALHRVGGAPRFSAAVRLAALAAVPGGLDQVDAATFELLLAHLPADTPVDPRSLAADVVSRARFTSAQLGELVDAVPAVGPLDLDRVLAAFAQAPEEKLGLRLVDNLRRSAAAASLPGDKLLARFALFPDDVRAAAKKLQAALEMTVAEQRERLQTLLDSLPAGDVRRGQQVFHSEKTACFACHAMGYLGGNIGPDLTRIGRIRSDRDLLEAVLYPDASFVRSYEPINVITARGQIVSGLLREDNGLEVVITTSERKNVRIAHADIEEIQPGQVSVMPGGLDKQLTPQQLADLLEFLKSTR